MSMLPPNYKNAAAVKKEMGSGGDPRYIDHTKLTEGQSINVRPCGTHASGHIIAGYEYYSEALKRTRRFCEFPEDYLEDIGLSYNGRMQNTGEKDTPSYFMAIAVHSKENDMFSILFLPKLKLREKIERIYAINDYVYEGDAIAPFFLTITRIGTGKDTVYDAMPTLKPAPAAILERWDKAKAGIWLPALFDGADAFSGRPASATEPASLSKGQPPVATDALGAQVQPSATAATGGAW